MILAILLSLSFQSEASHLKFIEPVETIFAGKTRFVLETDLDLDDLIGVELLINGESAHYFDEPPFECEIDMKWYKEGDVHIKAVLSMFGNKEYVAELAGKNFPNFEQTEVHLVRVPVMVEGLSSAHLEKSDFSILEDGQPQEAALLFDEQKPMHLVILLDLSGSMERHVAMLRRGVFTLIDSLRPGDRIQVIGFNHEVFQISPVETDMELVKKQLYMVEGKGSTNLFGAVWSGIMSASKATERRALILFTDGYHELDGMRDPYKKTQEDCVELAQKWGVPIFAMGLGMGIRPDTLESFAAASGGQAYLLRNMRTVRKAFADIGTELRRQILLCYYTRSKRGGWHEIKVTINQAGARLRYPKKVYFKH